MTWLRVLREPLPALRKCRLMTAVFPYYKLHDTEHCDLRQSFVYAKAKHITLGSIARGESPTEATLYDQPEKIKSKLRIAGPFTVETLQSYEPLSPEELAYQRESDEGFYAGGPKSEDRGQKEKKAYLHLGPKVGTVSKQAVSDAIKEARRKGDADWLLILGFSFESNLQDMQLDQGSFQVSIVRMHDDLLEDGLMKKESQVEIRGLDIYDPIKDEVKSRAAHDIAYWMVDDDYDGTYFVVKQVFFSGGSKSGFAKWKKDLDALAVAATKKKAERTLRIEIDEEAFERLYGTVSLPIQIKRPGQKIAVRRIFRFGEETSKVMEG